MLNKKLAAFSLVDDHHIHNGIASFNVLRWRRTNTFKAKTITK